MRTLIALACVVIGLLLVVLSFLNPSAVRAFQPYLLYVGIGLLLLGLILAMTRTSRRPGDEIAAVRDGHPGAVSDVAVREVVAPPKAEVTLRVGGNGASDPSVRWYHVAAATGTDVAARKAGVSVSVRGEEVGAEHWQWQTGDRAVDLTPAGARIPMVIGGVSESAQPLASGWVVPFKNWYLTPNASSTLGPFLAPFIGGFRHVFDVTVSWSERGTVQSSAASFELRFWREPTSEPRFIRLGDRPSYRDQTGGLAELRAKGVALRNDGMMLPPASLAAWLGRVDTWTNEARDLIAEVSVADSDYFQRLTTVDAPLFEGVRVHDDRHREALRGLHERLTRLQTFIRT